MAENVVIEMSDPGRSVGLLIHLSDFANVLKPFIGSNFLSIPFGLKQCGLGLGVGSLLLMGILTAHCCHLLIKCRYYAINHICNLYRTHDDSKFRYTRNSPADRLLPQGMEDSTRYESSLIFDHLVSSEVAERKVKKTEEELNKLRKKLLTTIRYGDMARMCFGKWGFAVVNSAILLTQLGFTANYAIFTANTIYGFFPVYNCTAVQINNETVSLSTDCQYLAHAPWKPSPAIWGDSDTANSSISPEALHVNIVSAAAQHSDSTPVTTTASQMPSTVYVGDHGGSTTTDGLKQNVTSMGSVTEYGSASFSMPSEQTASVSVPEDTSEHFPTVSEELSSSLPIIPEEPTISFLTVSQEQPSYPPSTAVEQLTVSHPVLEEETTSLFSEQQTSPPLALQEITSSRVVFEELTTAPLVSEEQTRLTSEEQTISQSALSSVETTPAPVVSTEETTAPVVSTQKITAAPVVSTDQTRTAPVVSTEEITAARMVSTEKTMAAPVTATEETTAAPVVSTEETTAAPAVSTKETTAAPVVSTEETTAAHVVSTEQIIADHVVSIEQTTAASVVSTEQTTPIPAEKSTSPSLVSKEQMTLPPLASSQQTTFSGLVSQELTSPSVSEEQTSSSVVQEQTSSAQSSMSADTSSIVYLEYAAAAFSGTDPEEQSSSNITVWTKAWSDAPDLRLFFLVPTAVFLVLVLPRSIRALGFISGTGNVGIIGGALLVLLALAAQFQVSDSWMWYRLEGLPVFFGTVASAFEGAGIILPVEAAMDGNHHNFPCLLYICVGLVLLIYEGICVLSYLTFGDSIQQIITMNIAAGSGLSIAVNICLMIGIICTFPLMVFPVVNMVDRALFGPDGFCRTKDKGLSERTPLLAEIEEHDDKYLSKPNPKRARKNEPWKRNVIGIVVVLIIVGLGILLRDSFAYISAFIGALGSTMIAYILPCLFHLRLCWPQLPLPVKLKDIVIIVAGLIFTVTGVYSVIISMF